jgi:hypothetical protein
VTCARGPSSEADLTRGGVQPSSEADPARGGVQPSSEANIEGKLMARLTEFHHQQRLR